jgi:thioredoxin:protein disulfide reductase
VVRWTVRPATTSTASARRRVALDAGVVLGEPQYPKGEMHSDEFFGEQEVYRGDFVVTVPYHAADVGTSR